MSIDRDMKQTLLELEMVSAGRIYSYEPVGSKGAFASREPLSGDANPPHVQFRREWEMARTDAYKADVLKRAREELARLKKREAPHKPGETPDERDKRIAVEGEGWSVGDAAVHFRCGPRDVRRARVAHGRHPETGVLRPTTDQQVIRARQLAGKGLTQKQIAQILDVSQPSVSRLLAA